MLVLFESPSGYALFKVLDEAKLAEVDNIWKEFESPSKASDLLKLMAWKPFEDTAEALNAARSLGDGKVEKGLRKWLKKSVGEKCSETLGVAEAKFGSALKEKLELKCTAGGPVPELMRGIRKQLEALVGELTAKDAAAMQLGLAHSLSRYRLKFSPEKVDTMIVQAVSLLDDLDKELNNYQMRCREWYGWHFPELGKIVQDHQVFAKIVLKVGLKEKMKSSDLSDILPADLEEQVKEAAEISMGTEISDLDILNIRQLCTQIIEINTYRGQLYDYLKNRMTTLAPNLTTLLGELVGARLVSHAGSLINLAKYPASTVQILGAEKALFRALKTKKDTPKYGLLYHAQLVGSAPGKLKGKMSRMLAAKASLAVRVDALADNAAEEYPSLGMDHRAYLETRMTRLQAQGTSRISGAQGKGKPQRKSYQFKSDVVDYDPSADSTLPTKKKRKFSQNDSEDDDASAGKKKVKKEAEEEEEQEEAATDAKKKKKKRKTSEPAEEEEEVSAPKKKKKKKVKEEPEDDDE